MALSITSNYAGKESTQIFTQAIYSAPTIAGNGVTLMPGVKQKMNLRKADVTGLVQADGCDFNASGTLTLTEAILDPTALKTNFQGCKSDYEQYWMADQMRPGQLNSDATPEFKSFVMEYFGNKIGEALEFNIWSGNLPGALSGVTSTGYTSFDGLIKAINAGSPVITNGYAINATTVVSALTAAFIAAPAKIRKPDMKFYVSPNTAAYYQLNQGTIRTNEQGPVGVRPLNFMGYEILVSPGVPDNNIFVAQPGNLVVGTDVAADYLNFQTIDMTPIDGSMNFRYVSRYAFGVSVVYTAEVAWFKSTS